MRKSFQKACVRHSSPRRSAHEAPEEARPQVDDLKKKDVNCIRRCSKRERQEGLFNRMDTQVYDAIAQQAKADGLPFATHTEELRVMFRTPSPRGPLRSSMDPCDVIPAAMFEQIHRKDIAYDPMLSDAEAARDVQRHQMKLLDRSLVQQVAPKSLLDSTRAILGNGAAGQSNAVDFSRALEIAQTNLLAAWKAGDTLIAGSDAGRLLVIHGPTVQRELELWVQAGIPAGIALRAATFNAASVWGRAPISDRFRPDATRR